MPDYGILIWKGSFKVHELHWDLGKLNETNKPYWGGREERGWSVAN